MFSIKERLYRNKLQKFYSVFPSKSSKYISNYIDTFILLLKYPDSWMFDKNIELRNYAKSNFDFDTLAYLCVIHYIVDRGTTCCDYCICYAMYDLVYSLQYCKGFPDAVKKSKFALRSSLYKGYKPTVERNSYFGDMLGDQDFSNYLLLCGISNDWIFSES